MASVRISITMPKELVERVDEAARQKQMSRSEFFRDSVRRHFLERDWKRLQRIGAEHARRLGIQTEEDVERLIDEYRAEHREGI